MRKAVLNLRFPLPIGGLAAAGRRLLPRTPHVRDALVIFALVAAAAAVAFWVDLFETVDHFLHEHEDWNIDELILIALLSSVALVVFGYRRILDLRVEVLARGIAEAESRRLARHDPLTGLPNRRFFSEKLDEALRGTAEQGVRLALLMLDLDGFKRINDVYGHSVGDQALTETATRISSIMRDGSVLARLGGDEFAIIMHKINSLEDPTRFARRILHALAEPFMAGSTTMTLSTSVGIAVAPDDGTEPDELVRRADRALYRAKAEGKSAIRHFEPNMDAHLERRMLMERELRQAVASGAIIPFYQPIVSLDGSRILGFEALARWDSPTLGSVPPDVFIPIAEESGLIGTLSDMLLKQACSDACHWPEETTLSFNISPLQLRDNTLALRILAVLGQTGLDAGRLELEITESALVDHLDVAQVVIQQLRAAGVRIALDDFGTGYATLSQLLALHVDRLKIDRSFIERLCKDKDSSIVVRAIIGLANGFGLSTTAEGIEDKDQLAYLKANGCGQGQGYLFSEAVPAAEIAGLLKHSPPVRVVA